MSDTLFQSVKNNIIAELRRLKTAKQQGKALNQVAFAVLGERTHFRADGQARGPREISHQFNDDEDEETRGFAVLSLISRAIEPDQLKQLTPEQSKELHRSAKKALDAQHPTAYLMQCYKNLVENVDYKQGYQRKVVGGAGDPRRDFIHHDYSPAAFAEKNIEEIEF